MVMFSLFFVAYGFIEYEDMRDAEVEFMYVMCNLSSCGSVKLYTIYLGI